MRRAGYLFSFAPWLAIALGAWANGLTFAEAMHHASILTLMFWTPIGVLVSYLWTSSIENERARTATYAALARAKYREVA